MTVFKPNEEFFALYEAIRGNSMTMMEAYDRTEVVWKYKMKQAFGREMRKFSDFESFKSSFSRFMGRSIS